MNGHFRPQIKNGQITKRTQVTYSVRATPKVMSKNIRRSVTPLTPLAPIWSEVSVGTLAQNGLSLLGLDERLRSTETVVKEDATRPLALVGLLVCGALLAGGFMFSLRTHFIAHALSREEVKLKNKTEQVNTERQQFNAQFERAVSASGLDRAAREQNDLAPLEFDQKKIAEKAKKIAATEKAKKSSASTQRARSAGD